MREPTEYKGPPIQRSWRFAILRIRRLPSQASSSLLFPPRREMFHSSHGYGDVSKSRVHISIVSRRGLNILNIRESQRPMLASRSNNYDGKTGGGDLYDYLKKEFGRGCISQRQLLKSYVPEGRRLHNYVCLALIPFFALKGGRWQQRKSFPGWQEWSNIKDWFFHICVWSRS